MDLKDFRVSHETNTHFHLEHPSGRSLSISKSGLTERGKETIKKVLRQNFEEGGEVEEVENVPSQDTQSQDDSSAADNSIGENSSPVLTNLSNQNLDEQSDSQLQDDSSAADNSNESNPSTSNVPVTPLTPLNNQTQKDLIQKQSNIEKQMQDQIAQTYADQAAAQAKYDIKLNQIAQGKLEATDNLTKAITDNSIDYNRYWKNKDTGNKILSGLAIFLGGFGNKGENQALNIIRDSINKDIESQKSNNDKFKTLYQLNLQKYGTEQAATLASQTQGLAVTKSKLMQLMANSNSRQAVVKGQLAMNAINQQLAMQTNQLAKIQLANEIKGEPTTKTEGLLHSYESSLNPEDRKRGTELGKRIIPGVEGIASRDITPKEREDILKGNDLASGLKDLIDFGEKNSGSLNPAKISEGQTLMGTVLTRLREAQSAGVYKPSTAEFEKQLAGGNPTEFFNSIRSQPKYRKLLEDTQNTLSTKYKSLGIKPPQADNSAEAALRFVANNPNHPKAQEIKAKALKMLKDENG